ncbi:hypothetical protein BOMU111920_24690 [Bordetella muralis]|jgi:hypothetical protein
MTRRYRRVTPGHSGCGLKQGKKIKRQTAAGLRPGKAAAGQAGTSCQRARGSVSRGVSFTKWLTERVAVNEQMRRTISLRAPGALNYAMILAVLQSRLRHATTQPGRRAKSATPPSGRARLRRRPRGPGAEPAGSGTMTARALDGDALLHLYAGRLVQPRCSAPDVQPLKAVPIICRFP